VFYAYGLISEDCDYRGTPEDVGPVGVVAGIDEANGSTDTQNAGGGLGRLHLMMRQLSGSGSGHGHSLVEEGSWNWWPFGGETSIQSSRRNRHDSVGALRLRNNASTGLGTRADTRITAMVAMVREVLPHVPDELIAQVCCMHALTNPYLNNLDNDLGL
jgi:autocrine motility factor receptor